MSDATSPVTLAAEAAEAAEAESTLKAEAGM